GGRVDRQPRAAGRVGPAECASGAGRGARRAVPDRGGDRVSARALVLGASGFLGRHLLLALADDGVEVVAGCRTQRSYDDVVLWLRGHGVDARPELALVDFTAPALGVAGEQLAGVTEIYNCAGAYRFGMTDSQARAANVDTARAVVMAAADIAGLRRLVHVSGYRVGGQDPTGLPWTSARREETYRQLGAYAASKVEAYAVVQDDATRLEVPWTNVTPPTVSRHSETGEADMDLVFARRFLD